MKIAELSLGQMARTGCTHRFELTYADLNDTAGTAKTITLTDTLALGAFVSNVCYKVVTLFQGGSTTDLTVQVGYDVATGTDDMDGLLTPHSIHNAATYIKAGPGPVGEAATDAVDGTYGSQESTVIASLRTKLNDVTRNLPKAFQESGSVVAVFTSTTANLDALTRGEIHIYLRLAQL